MKKLIVIMLALIMTLACAACSSGEIKPPSDVQTVTDKPAAENTDKAEPEKTEASPEETEAVEQTEAPAGKVTVEEMVLVDEQGVKITLKSLETDSFMGPELKLLIENDTDKDLTFSARDVSVNGYMNSALFYSDVAAGKKANDELTLSGSDLKACRITTIADVELSFHIYEGDSFTDYFDTDPIVIETSAHDGFEYVYDEEGTLAFEDNGIKIIVKGLTDTSIFGPGVLFYIVNTSDKNVTVTTRDVSVNGFMVDDVFYCDVLAGKHAVEASVFMSTSLEENGIETIEEIEMTFHITDSDTYRKITDSDVIKISF